MRKLRCAIYTRKSSEEGLDQSFNSLDAQRAACEAYIASQAGERWVLNPSQYDDGGWSGGNIDRPGLQRLLAEVSAGKIDIVVVYKVDRLTRSLADFAKMVDVFDQSGTSFVSVTQAFNTTTSMGRLTLNVLLSFAQFEREVTGERIRDKIAASKARGMWMGGYPPLGYDKDGRTLIVNEDEAITVRRIFSRYLELGSVYALAAELEAEGVLSKRWTAATGKVRGGAVLSHGALIHMLGNRIYTGEITHKGASHPGQHDAIVDLPVFEAVQRRLLENRASRIGKARARAPLTGLIYDAEGNRMSPAHTRNRHGERYLYYVSAPLQRGGSTSADTLRRVPARALEEVVFDRLRAWSGRTMESRSELLREVRRVTVSSTDLIVDLAPAAAAAAVLALDADEAVSEHCDGSLQIRTSIRLNTRGGQTSLTRAGAAPKSRPNRTLISALRRAHQELQGRGMNITDTRERFLDASGIDDPYLRKLTTLAFLAPDIQRTILEGRQPAGLTLSQILAEPLSLDWHQQRTKFGFAAN